MDHFVLHSEYAPTGDQPQAIDALVKGFKEGNQFQTLLGVTGSGKTFTMQLMALRMRRKNIQTFIIAPLKGNEFYRACNNIGGDASSQSYINCNDIKGDAHCDGDITYMS